MAHMWRYRIVSAILRLVFVPYYFIRFRCRVKKEKLPQEGAVILCNHVTTLDPVLVGMKFDRPIFYMSSKHVFQNRWIGKILRYLVNPIPKEKINKSDIAAIKACMQITRANGSICIFPEGNRTFTGKLGYVDPAIIKLVKRLGKPLIVCNILGGYGCEPRWCNAQRRGKIDITVRRVYSAEEVGGLHKDTLYAQLVSELTVDEFFGDNRYKSKRRAECLESLLCVCPVCRGMHCLHSKKQQLHCSNCGNVVTYNEDMTLSCDNPKFPFRYVHEWYDDQTELLKKKEYPAQKRIYTDEVQVYKPRMWQKKVLVGKGQIQLYGDGIRFSLDSGEISLPIADILGITLIGNKIMDIYIGDLTYRVKAEHATNLIKYMHTYYIIQNRAKGIENGSIGI